MLNIYVVPDGGGWSVKRGADSLAVIATCCHKADAIAFAESLARAEGVRLIIADESGRLEEKVNL